MHGGAIGFSSNVELGSTFSFYVKSRRSKPALRQDIPITNTTKLSIRARETILHNLVYKGADESPVQLTNTEVAVSDLHILIVEDNLVNQRVLAKQLRNLGMHVAVTNHGGEALEYLRSTDYYMANGSNSTNTLSLILMDWEMPIMDGLECVCNIRQLQAQGIIQGHVPVIAVTANVRAEQVTIALAAGMDNVISKPFRIPELLACITQTLQAITDL
jgi:CheY-like chemotaxis protein